MSEFDEITNSEDIIDSRDIQARINYLESLSYSEDESLNEDQLDEWESAELELLKGLKEEIENNGGSRYWNDGIMFIRDSYFENYAQEFAEDCGLIEDNAK